ncbi:MAG: phosphate/phosphite/phosphonate ABC transporter substrate-binding protein, partial [Proteobacteria bacterium]
SEPISNDPIIFRKDMPDDMKIKITDAFFAFVQTPEGKDVFNKIYGVTEFKRATDADYEPVRNMLNALGKNAAELMKK